MKYIISFYIEVNVGSATIVKPPDEEEVTPTPSAIKHLDEQETQDVSMETERITSEQKSGKEESCKTKDLEIQKQSETNASGDAKTIYLDLKSSTDKDHGKLLTLNLQLTKIMVGTCICKSRSLVSWGKMVKLINPIRIGPLL